MFIKWISLKYSIWFIIHNSYLQIRIIVASYLCLLACPIEDTSALERAVYSQQGIIERLKRSVTETCCFVHTCEKIPLDENDHNAVKCYNKEVCGSLCTQTKNKSSVPTLPTPGYSRKDSYIEKYCDLIGCSNYRFNCNLCPDPKNVLFRVYSIPTGCISCYY